MLAYRKKFSRFPALFFGYTSLQAHILISLTFIF